jgi:DNA (cytosine-5)-methyltransferase 1
MTATLRGGARMLTHGELFAGISGFGLGFERAGIKTLWAVEIDPSAQRVLRHHHPDALLFEDVRDVGSHNLPPVDIITFGSPCQDLSVAGRRKGFDGERSGLYFEAIRIIAELRPALAVWENVPGAFSSNGGRDFGAALDALADIGALDIAWRVLDAQWFGVAQRRRRVFVVADFGSERAGEILFEPESSSGDSPPSRTPGQDVAGSLSTGASSSGGFRQDLDGTTYIPLLEVNARQGKSPEGSVGIGDPGGPMYTLNATNQHGVAAFACDVADTLSVGANQTTGFVGDVVAHTLRAEGLDASEDGTNGQAVAFTNRGFESGDQAETLRATEHGALPMVAVQDVHPTLAANTGGPGSQDWQQQRAVASGIAVRRLTPTECLRLQGFPDDWLDLDPPLSDSAKYRMIGNAVAVPVAAWLGNRIVEALR